MAATTEPVWDVTIGGLGFLLASGEQRPYLRESTPARRERFDSARDPGDNSLDSALWIRSQTSWHLGGGVEFAEPLEDGPETVRFQFHQSYGADVFSSPGKATPLKQMQLWANSGLCERLIPHGGSGAIAYWGASANAAFRGLRYIYTTVGVAYSSLLSALTDLYSDSITSVMVGGTGHWFAYSAGSGQLRDGTATGGGDLGFSSDNTLQAFGRLFMSSGVDLYEIPDSTLPTLTALPTPRAGFFSTPGQFLNLASNSRTVYGHDGGRGLWGFTVNTDGSLAAVKQMAQVPMGESIAYVHCYGDWLLLSTDKGVRVCDASDPDRVIVGPVTIPAEVNSSVSYVTVAAPHVTTFGGYAYVVSPLGLDSTFPTGGTADRSGFYRIDLGRQLTSLSSSLAGKYAWAFDQAVTGTAGQMGRSVCLDGTRTFFLGGSSGSGYSIYHDTRFYNGSTMASWIASGQINFSTAEKKAWLSLNVDAGGSSGTIRAYVSGPDGTEREVTPGAVATPVTTSYTIDGSLVPAGGWLKYRIALTGNAELYSAGLIATPLPKRTRYIRLPLSCFDWQTDRNGVEVGHEGYAFERLSALEGIETSGQVVQVVDNRTGESRRCLVDKVSYEGVTPPSGGAANYGGFVNVTLLAL